MKIRSEIRAALIGIGAMVVLIWGIHYLKGRNVLKSSYLIHTCMEHSGGLAESAPVLYRGVRIGFVESIRLGKEPSCPVVVSMNIENEYPFSKGSVAELFSSDILGTKAIRIHMAEGNALVVENDTLPSGVATDLIKSFQDQVIPLVEKLDLLAQSLDLLAGRMDSLISEKSFQSFLKDLSGITRSLKQALVPGGSLSGSFENLESLTTTLVENEEKIESILTHLESASAAMDSAGIGDLGKDLRETSTEMNKLLKQINSGEGSAGKLIYSDSLHQNLLLLVTDLDSLVRDLGENPENYVQISIFGKSGKKK